MKHYILFLFSFFAYYNISFSQKSKHSIGINTSFSYNEFNLGMQYTNYTVINKIKTKPRFIFQINYGLLGLKEYQQYLPDTTNQNIIFNKYNDIPYIYDKGSNYVSYQKVKNIGFNSNLAISVGQFKGFFVQLGLGVLSFKDIGYIKIRDAFTGNEVTQSLNTNFFNISIFSRIGFHYDLNKKYFIQGLFNLKFIMPLLQEDKSYQLLASLPTLAVEQDLSISINYKF